MLTAEQPAAEHPLPKVPDWTGPEKLTGEKEMLGFYITGHPLDQYKDKVAELATHTTSNLEGLAKGTEVALCGILTGVAAQAHQGRQALGRDADRGPGRLHRSDGLLHAIRAPATRR